MNRITPKPTGCLGFVALGVVLFFCSPLLVNLWSVGSKAGPAGWVMIVALWLGILLAVRPRRRA